MKPLEITEILLHNYEKMKHGGSRANQALSYSIRNTPFPPSDIQKLTAQNRIIVLR